VREERVPNLIHNPDLDAIVANLREMAGQIKVVLPTDVALYIARNFQSNASALERALIRLLAHSSMSGTEITLAYTQRVLGGGIGKQARKATIDPPQKLFSEQIGTRQATSRRQDPTTTDSPFVLCLLKTRDGEKSRVRHELLVNMRETERERMARRDAYERDFERRAKKRKQG
jgi:hypothetical protein